MSVSRCFDEIEAFGIRQLEVNGTKTDPLSTALSISEEDKKDPRVEKAIEEMLEEYVW